MEERKIGKVGITKMAFSRKQKKAFLTAAVTAGVYLSFRYLLPLVFPFLAAYLMALFLRPSAAFLEKRLRISFRGRMIGVPIGMIGGVELILLSIFGNSYGKAVIVRKDASRRKVKHQNTNCIVLSTENQTIPK